MELAIVGLVVAGVLALMYFTRKKDETKPPVDEPDFFEDFPDVQTPPEILAGGAENTSAEALEEAHQAEIDALLDQNAAVVRSYEEMLALLQEQSILEPTTPEYSEIAAQEEAAAQEARARLEAQWNLSLNTAQSAMERAEQAANDAWGAFHSAYSKVIEYERAADKVAADMQLWNKFKINMEQAGNLALVREYSAKIESLWNEWNSLKGKTAEAQNVATRVKVSAVHAVSNANDCIGIVLSITADIRLLGILLSLCNRVDVIARATRTKLGELESRMFEMSEITLARPVLEPSVPIEPPAPEPALEPPVVLVRRPVVEPWAPVEPTVTTSETKRYKVTLADGSVEYMTENEISRSWEETPNWVVKVAWHE